MATSTVTPTEPGALRVRRVPSTATPALAASSTPSALATPRSVSEAREVELYKIIREEREANDALRSTVIAREIEVTRLQIRVEDLSALAAEAIRAVARHDLDRAGQLLARHAEIVAGKPMGAEAGRA